MGDLQLNYIQARKHGRELKQRGTKIDLNSDSKMTLSVGSWADLGFLIV